MKSIAVFGAGGFGREVAWIVEACAKAGAAERVVCFLDDKAQPGQSLMGYPVLTPDQAKSQLADLEVVVGIGTPKTKETVAEKARALGFRFYTAIHPGAHFRKEGLEIGEGSTICAGVVMTTDIVIGRHCQVNIGTTIGHDCVLGDYATITPGVNLTGRVHVGRRAYIGIGANLVCRSTTEPLVIGDDAIVAAGAVVLKNVAPGTMVAGIPAVPKTASRGV
jgi:sugar O-acyltransferase (sialic acid O-acetyltransferase NeuD family)